ncbi:Prefoldin subunit-domain-containing protein [Pelagophyceae sp. CCMP2097]|nr:Prefoldin subunit-domain-containing protein [Pelagophyceae sp. CCMP2097]|mmetsp:Transcript_4290/g.13454  ORF Transcript_4290/g.13454 Transcript_4290/m.13454 type:complete len:159 (-) Transcript_4290:80-556(-)
MAQQKGQEMDISKLSLDQLNGLKSQHEEELQQLSMRHTSLKTAEARFRESRQALISISPEDEGAEMLVPLTQSLYVPGRVADVDTVLVDIGTGYYLEKSRDAATIMLDGKIDLVTKSAESITNVMAAKQRNFEAICMVMQYKIAQIQERKAQHDQENS